MLADFALDFLILLGAVMSFYTSLTGINAAISRLNVASNNISNAQTDTFKKSRVTFQDIYSHAPQQLKIVATGQGASVAAINQQFTQGSIVTTGKTLDIAIAGEGFYVMQDKNKQISYSRLGQFSTDGAGYIVNSDGEKLMGSKGVAVPNSTNYTLEPIRIPPKTVGQFKSTTEIKFGVNLPSQDPIAEIPFDPEISKTYSRKNILTIYDTNGNPHDVIAYFSKKTNPSENYPYTDWVTHFYIDGKKVEQPGRNPDFVEGKNYIEWKGAGFNSGDFGWPSSAQPDISDGAVAIVGDKVYQGNGKVAKVIGLIDPEENGKSGNSLRINFIEQTKPLNEILQNGIGVAMTSGLKPIGFIPVGSEKVTIGIDSYSQDDDIQLFTQDGRHLLGTPIIDANADVTWSGNNVASVEDVNSNVVVDKYGFSIGAKYNGEPPIIESSNLSAYTEDPKQGVKKVYNGMTFLYTGDGDRSKNESVQNDGDVQNTKELVVIDKTTEPIFLMVSGSGKFGVQVSWDKMPEEPQFSINKSRIKELITYRSPSDEIKFTMSGAGVVVGNPQYLSKITMPDGSQIPDIKVSYDATTGYSSEYSVTDIIQNGKPEGDISSFNISRDGVLSASYTNGYTADLSTLIIAKFNNVNGLRQLGDTKYKESTLSGAALVNRAGYGGMGTLQSGAVEKSNVDVTSELLDLIEAQRNFQSNSKAIEAADKLKKVMQDNLG